MIIINGTLNKLKFYDLTFLRLANLRVHVFIILNKKHHFFFFFLFLNKINATSHVFLARKIERDDEKRPRTDVQRYEKTIIHGGSLNRKGVQLKEEETLRRYRFGVKYVLKFDARMHGYGVLIAERVIKPRYCSSRRN